MTDLTLNEFKKFSKEKLKEALNIEKENILGFVPDKIKARSCKKRCFRRYFLNFYFTVSGLKPEK